MKDTMAEVGERRGSVDGIETHWWEAPVEGTHAPVLYVHGVPTAGWQWSDFLARTGGYAPDLPGFGESDKLASFDYSIDGYARWLRAFADQRGLDRFSLVVHDWGGVGVALAQEIPERIERLAICAALPLMPGYRWHWIARNWRRRVVGELAMGFTFKASARVLLDRSNRDPLPREFVDRVWADFDHGTQRAILKLYRAGDPDTFPAHGARLGELRCPALVLYGERDPYISPDFAQRYADALGGPATARVVEDAGHWPWYDEPALVDEIAAFVTGHDSSRTGA
jgi:pimeloyl-ACP methyl ester carboxylesterase